MGSKSYERRRRGRDAAQHLLDSREGAGEGVFASSAAGTAEGLANPELVIGVGGCVASQEGRRDPRRAPFVDVVFGPQTLHRVPAIDRRRACAAGRAAGAAGRRELPRNREVRPLPEPRVDGPTALGVGDGRLQQVLHVLRGALHARREVSRPVADVMREVVASGAPGRARDQFARPERQRVSRRRSTDDHADLAELIHYVGRDRGHRTHPLHDVASRRVLRQPDRRVTRGAGSS